MSSRNYKDEYQFRRDRDYTEDDYTGNKRQQIKPSSKMRSKSGKKPKKSWTRNNPTW